MSLILALLLLQTTPTPPLERGTALPPPGGEEGQVMAPIDALMRALGKSDGAGVLAVVRPEGVATVALERPDGTRRVVSRNWTAFAEGIKPGPDRFEERLGQPAIEIDGDVAMVWVGYTALTNGTVAHCGTNLFDMVRENGAWRIANVTWSQRTTGCEAR